MIQQSQWVWIGHGGLDRAWRLSKVRDTCSLPWVSGRNLGRPCTSRALRWVGGVAKACPSMDTFERFRLSLTSSQSRPICASSLPLHCANETASSDGIDSQSRCTVDIVDSPSLELLLRVRSDYKCGTSSTGVFVQRCTPWVMLRSLLSRWSKDCTCRHLMSLRTCATSLSSSISSRPSSL